MITKAKVLQFIPDPNDHGMIKNGILYKSGAGLEPQLFPEYATKEWLEKSINLCHSVTLDMFKLVNVEIKYLKS